MVACRGGGISVGTPTDARLRGRCSRQRYDVRAAPGSARATQRFIAHCDGALVIVRDELLPNLSPQRPSVVADGAGQCATVERSLSATCAWRLP